MLYQDMSESSSEFAGGLVLHVYLRGDRTLCCCVFVIDMGNIWCGSCVSLSFSIAD